MHTGLRKARWRDPGVAWSPITRAVSLAAGPAALTDSVHLVASYDEDQQTLLLEVTRWDLSERVFEPCFATLAVREIGPFGAVRELLDVAARWAAECVEAYGLPEPFTQCGEVLDAFPEG